MTKQYQFACAVVFIVDGFVDATDEAEAKKLIDARMEKVFEHPDVDEAIFNLLQGKKVYDCSYYFTTQEHNIEEVKQDAFA
jgi:hypothetical protein